MLFYCCSYAPSLQVQCMIERCVECGNWLILAMFSSLFSEQKTYKTKSNLVSPRALLPCSAVSSRQPTRRRKQYRDCGVREANEDFSINLVKSFFSNWHALCDLLFMGFRTSWQFSVSRKNRNSSHLSISPTNTHKIWLPLQLQAPVFGLLVHRKCDEGDDDHLIDC